MDFLYFCRIILRLVSMKKNIVFCLCIAVIAMFSACNKTPDGVYIPSKKIQKIYTVDNGTQTPKEVWHWNGDLLMSIDDVSNYDHAMEIYTTTFSYDKSNRLIAIDDFGVHGECIYDGNKIEKIIFTSEGVEMGRYEFEHKGNKISQIKIKFDDGWDDIDWDKAGMIKSLRYLFPEICPAAESAVRKCSKESKGDEVVMNLNWSGNNVKTIDVNYSGFLGTVTEKVEITYDNKINPTCGLLAQLGNDAVSNLFLNKNNPLTIITSANGSVFDKQTYTYEYEDNYPVKVTRSDIENEGTLYEEREITTTIYEY
jgi:hypothetical protein